MKKRGLSTVITTLIIIVLVLVAIGIVWVVIANMVSEGSEQIFLDKFTTDLKFKSVYTNDTANGVTIDVKRNAGRGDLQGIKFIFSDGRNSEAFEEMNINLQELTEKRFVFILSQLNITNVETVSISPIYKGSSGKKIFGQILASYRLRGAGILGSCIASCSNKECGSEGCGGFCGNELSYDNGSYCSDMNPSEDYYCSSGTCIAGVNPCDLASASWSTLNVEEGTSVTLNTIGTNCVGVDLNYSVYENDLIGDSLVTSFTLNSLNPTWIAQWMDDGTLQGEPEYYFTVTVVDNPSEQITSSGGDLTVTQNVAPIDSIVERAFPSSTVSAGGQITVTLDVEIVNGETFYSLEEYVPSGWTVISNGTMDGTVVSTRLVKAIISGATSTSYNYIVQAPSTAGTYNFNGIYYFEGDTVESTTAGQTTVTVN